MNNYQQHFKNKKILLMGLGLLGRGIGVAKFLAECGTKLTITDLKTKEQLAPAIKALSKFKSIKYILGEHRLQDFKDKDMIIRAANVPIKSPYIKEAKKNKIPVEMDASLFAKLTLAKIIGITGTRGKSTVTKLIYKVLDENYTTGKIHLGGNIKGLATLPLLKKAKKNDIVVLELDSWQCQGFGEAKISPQIAVFTNFLNDHMNYYKNDMNRYFQDKANIFRNQKKDDFLIVSEEAKKEISQRFKGRIKGQSFVTDKTLAQEFPTKLIGEHNQLNVSLAVAVLLILGIKKSEIKRSLKNYAGEPGRLEFIKSIRGVSYYNDTNSTTPDACIVALKSLSTKTGKHIVLIGGGADKELQFEKLIPEIKKRVKFLVLFKGSATNKIISLLPKKFPYIVVENMKSALAEAQTQAKRGDIILLSPGAASFGVFKNEYDRGEKFLKEIKKC